MNQKNDGTKRANNGRFLPGNKGGPGRKRGEPNLIARAVRKNCQEKADDIARIVLDQALEGNLEAVKIILERLYPKPKDCPVDLPDLGESLSDMTSRVIEAVAEGSLTPSEGNILAGIVATHCKVIEVSDLARRVDEIKKQLDERNLKNESQKRY